MKAVVDMEEEQPEEDENEWLDPDLRRWMEESMEEVEAHAFFSSQKQAQGGATAASPERTSAPSGQAPGPGRGKG